MATFSPEVVVDTAGIIPLGSSLYGQVTVYAEAVVAARIIKSAGTASRTLFVRHASVACNLAV